MITLSYSVFKKVLSTIINTFRHDLRPKSAKTFLFINQSSSSVVFDTQNRLYVASLLVNLNEDTHHIQTAAIRHKIKSHGTKEKKLQVCYIVERNVRKPFKGIPVAEDGIAWPNR